MMEILIVIISIIVLSLIITTVVALIQTLSHKQNKKYYFAKSFGNFFHVFFQYFVCSYIPFIDVIFEFLGSIW